MKNSVIDITFFLFIRIFAEENDFDISQFTITQIVLKALTELHGQVGLYVHHFVNIISL